MTRTETQRPYWQAWGRGVAVALLAAGTTLPLAGCSSDGAVFGALAYAIPQYTTAAYKGLAKQRVAVMVWGDAGVRSDYPDLTIDTASGIQNKLLLAQKDPNPDDLKGATFPIQPDSVVRFQEDHPEYDNVPITQTAARLNVDRLIYVEISKFATRSEASLDLYHGSITASVQVVEIGDGTARVAYQDPNVNVSFPKDDPKEGEPEGSDAKVYTNTLDAFTTDIAERFYKHEHYPDG